MVSDANRFLQKHKAVVVALVGLGREFAERDTATVLPGTGVWGSAVSVLELQSKRTGALCERRQLD